MSEPQTFFTIIREADCPLYRLGEEFLLTGLALSPPMAKPVCIQLARDIANLRNADDGGGPKGKGGEIFTCSGCNGSVGIAIHHPIIQGDRSEQIKTIENIAHILSGFSMFRSLSAHQIRDLVALIRLAQYESGQEILRKGEPGRHLYIILSGRVEVLDENLRNIAVLEKGEVFGEMSLLSGEPVNATIRVTMPTKVLYFHGRDFSKVLHKYPPLQLYLAKLLTRRLARTTNIRLEETTVGMSGSLAETPPPELCQTININQKTGVLLLKLDNGTARISFRDGNIIKASYGEKQDKGAFFEILKANDGHFHFHPGIPAEEKAHPEIGHFMCLLMEGVSRMDEESVTRNQSS
ncbi:MAG: DUF4388 domain-containing protein [Thermodesulfobacteriota bacterium]